MRRGTVLLLLALLVPSNAAAWRSALYAADWTPATTDASGRFLHDFSYAGYHSGVDPIPDIPPGETYDVTTFGADPSGATDSTLAIQAAIDAAGAAGGGIVHLPAGTYRVRPQGADLYALRIARDGVVLRGAGADRTFLFNDASDMRGRRVIWVAPRDEYFAWQWGPLDAQPLVADAPSRATQVSVGDASAFAVGDEVIVLSDATDALIAELGMTGTWTSADTAGPTFLRRIVAIEGGLVTLDVPLRLALRTRDGARLHHPALTAVREVGIEHLAIGNRQNDVPGTDSDDYANAGTGAYQMHDSFFVYFDHAVDSWMRDVVSYRPIANSIDAHFLSNAVRLDFSARITLARLTLSSPQYEGEGGNGYLITLTANDCLVQDSVLSSGRHNVSFSFMHSSGNVVLRTTARSSRLPVDFHQRLAFANLLDGMTLDGDHIELAFRDCCGHGHGTTESVVWNANGARYPTDQLFERFIVDTQQLGMGYVIGTRGAAPEVRARTGDGTAPVDLVEGLGMGDTLEPASLYEDQRRRRLGIVEPMNLAPVVDAGPEITTTVGAAASLAGTATDDGRPSLALAVAWTALDGTGVFADASAATTTVTFDIAGTYRLELSADDGAARSADTTTVRVLAEGADGGGLVREDAGIDGGATVEPLPDGCACRAAPREASGSVAMLAMLVAVGIRARRRAR